MLNYARLDSHYLILIYALMQTMLDDSQSKRNLPFQNTQESTLHCFDDKKRPLVHQINARIDMVLIVEKVGQKGLI